MSSGDVLSGFLWRARAGIRTEGLPLFAGHGMADPAYRPPRLPYISVVGPLTVELEPDRDLPRSVQLAVQTPGYLPGARREPADRVPASGPLVLLIDGDATGSVDPDLATLTGQSFVAAGVGVAVATALQQAVRTADFRTDGAIVTDPARRAELAAVTVRWDGRAQRLVLSSGRRGVRTGAELDPRPSRVEIPAPAGPIATALGLADAVPVPGRLVRHRRPAPAAVAVDVRVDLWAGSQLDLAATLDAWTGLTATRGQLLERTALPAEDIPAGAASIRLQPAGEPASRSTLLQLEAAEGGGLADRVAGRRPALTSGATETATGIRLVDAGTASLTFFEAPPVPLAWLPEHPAPHGYAATFGLRTETGAVGERARILTVEADGAPALSVEIEYLAPTNGGPPPVRLRGDARRADGTA
ncbi:hypothetical protein [Cryptosporangium minutisporangium]|uniref:Uncharacterized protein n=1 Tax=Cryptosporangium minutisporangium TaxID=113569 RepID=A0ABP6SZH4_9ACTN